MPGEVGCTWDAYGGASPLLGAGQALQDGIGRAAQGSETPCLCVCAWLGAPCCSLRCRDAPGGGGWGSMGFQGHCLPPAPTKCASGALGVFLGASSWCCCCCCCQSGERRVPPSPGLRLFPARGRSPASWERNRHCCSEWKVGGVKRGHFPSESHLLQPCHRAGTGTARQCVIRDECSWLGGSGGHRLYASHL